MKGCLSFVAAAFFYFVIVGLIGPRLGAVFLVGGLIVYIVYVRRLGQRQKLQEAEAKQRKAAEDTQRRTVESAAAKQARAAAEAAARAAERAAAEAARATSRPNPPNDSRWASTDPYVILGVPRDADHATIRAAYVDLTKQYHPDRVATLALELRELAEARMRSINAAYERVRG